MGLKSFVPHAVLLSTALCVIAVRPATAQVLYGSVIGTITDQSDSVVPGATVTLTGKETGLTKEATSDVSGRYSLINVLPGHYDLKVVAKGFRTHLQTDTD
ncbi:MAG TPA: carboxypeptidase-like regulatory domain-containing protein, partial [Candidatus Acidoferrales bacterium]|nr:carboxypeptidase-like regulatory domain-containing protein [Candidatus Acidoferrales bacterium]